MNMKMNMKKMLKCSETSKMPFDDDVLITWMQNVHDANDAKMTIAEMLRYEMHSAHDANDAEVLSADMSSAHY